MIGTLQGLLFLAFYVAIFVMSAWAAIDLMRRPPTAFTQGGKLTKGKWGGILGIAVLVSFLSIPPPLGLPLPFPRFLALLAAVAAIVYLVDVKPAIAPYSRRRGGGPNRPSSSGW
ncbi:DUF2516 family protein [Cellulomonas sp. URHD0024]|uniref:DUF2516 family protein n=1 Tax=Cellulomonas sp. URHD0024 TaxID=1302620 RepID=UPI00041D5E8B|nr:DUF2516 family protein [Cellulomonas sp. URHD0024]